MQAELQSCTGEGWATCATSLFTPPALSSTQYVFYLFAAHGRQLEAPTLHEAELLQGQPLSLGRNLSDTSRTNLLASLFRDSQPGNSGRQAARPSLLTDHQSSSMSQPNHCKRLAGPPAAPPRKLPQHTFPDHSAAIYGSIPAAPVLDSMSDSSVGLCQRPLVCRTQSEAMQAEPVISRPQDAARAASMSALLAVAQPVSSAEELLQRLQYGSIAATANTSNGDAQHSGNSVVPALTSSPANDTGGSPDIEARIAATRFALPWTQCQLALLTQCCTSKACMCRCIIHQFFCTGLPDTWSCL